MQKEVLLIMSNVVIPVIVGAVCAVVFAVLGFVLGVAHRRKTAEKEIGSATQEATKIINNALAEAEASKKEKVLEAKDEVHKLRSDADRDIRERRNEVQRQEKRLNQREEYLDKKADSLEAKNDKISEKQKELENKLLEVDGIKKSQFDMLERISGLTQEEAKNQLLASLEEELDTEKSKKILEYEQMTRDQSEVLAREIIGTAIQRCAADHTAETTVSVVALPNDEMKGRIIGREGRNIRALETATGVDIIIDDTPEAVIVSAFDPIRREIARLTVERLINDGRIHPARIEEMVEKAKKEVENQIREAGEAAVFETNQHGIHHELVKLLGRLKYRTSYGQNVLKHSIEVSHIAGMMASELGADVQAAKRAGLLHDLGKAVDHEVGGSHVTIGVELARKYKESKEVIHAIHAHHNDVEPQTVIACLVQAADAISAARPGARRENLENYIKRLEKLEEIASSFKGVDNAYAIQAGREIRIMIKPEEVSEDEMIIMAHDIARKIEKELEYPGQIKVHVLRETTAIEYAK